MRGHPLDPCQVRAFHHVPCNNRALSAAICGCLAAPVMIYRFSRYSAYPCLRGLFNKERGRLLCVGDVRSPLPLSFHSRYKGCISGNGASAQSAKEPALAAGKCENEGRRGRLRPHGRTWELGSLTIFRNLAQLPRLTLSPRPGAALLGTHDPCPWLPGWAERLLSGGPTRGTRLGLRQVQAPVRAGGEGQSGHRAHLLQPRGLCGGDTDADAEESRERCPEGQRVQGENGCIPEVSGRPGRGSCGNHRTRPETSPGGQRGGMRRLSSPSGPRAWPVLNAKAWGQLWPGALSLSAFQWGASRPPGGWAPAPLSPEAGRVTSAPCSLRGSLSGGQAHSRRLGILPCRSLSRTSCSVTQWLFPFNMTDSCSPPPRGCTNPLMCVGSRPCPPPPGCQPGAGNTRNKRTTHVNM